MKSKTNNNKIILPVDNRHRIVLKRMFYQERWRWFLYKQIKMLFIWINDTWEGELLSTISYEDTKEEAMCEAMRIKKLFLSNE